MVLMWGTLTFPRPSKTFWVTIIAYTQAVVLIKCACQFDAWFWNDSQLPPTGVPFAPARLIGIEKKKGYATYDLILLLVVFCHRIILKSLGLWKEDEDGEKKEEKPVEKSADKYKVESKSSDIVKADENGKTVRVIDERDGVEVEISEEDGGSIDYVQLAKVSYEKYMSAAKEFVRQLFDRESRQTADIYSFLFLCDFFNFFVILFGFSAFGTQEGDGGVLSYFAENKVPISFLFMLIIQFAFMVVDRALYLRKNMFGKIIFQVCLIVGLHFWMFFILPKTTERIFWSTRPPMLYYSVKCLYLLFSAYQIRCGKQFWSSVFSNVLITFVFPGYPSRILGNFLTKGFGLLNQAGFKVFINIPFLFELRTLMDWVWTDTSMTLMDWLKMEDIFQNIYQLKVRAYQFWVKIELILFSS